MTNHRDQVSSFKKKIDKLSLTANSLLSKNPKKAADKYVSALRLSDDLYHILSQKNQHYFSPEEYVENKFYNVIERIKSDKETFGERSIFIQLNDGKNNLDSHDLYITKAIDDIMDRGFEITKKAEWSNFYSENAGQAFLLLSSTYSKISKTIEATPGSFLDQIRVHDNSISVKEIGDLIHSYKKNKSFRRMKNYIKYFYGTEKVYFEDICPLDQRSRMPKSDRKKILKSDIDYISDKIGGFGADLSCNFNNWFKEGSENSDDGGVRGFYRKNPQIVFNKIDGVWSRLIAVHEYGHALFHICSCKNRKFEDYQTNLMIDELLPQVFEVILILKMKNDSELAGCGEDVWLNQLIPLIYNGFLSQAVTTELSIQLAKKIADFDCQTSVEKCYLKILNDLYGDIIMAAGSEKKWITSPAFNRPFYSTAYLLSFPIAFNIAIDLLDNGEKGLLAINYLLGHKGRVSVDGLFKVLGDTNFDREFDRMFSWVSNELYLYHNKES